MYAASASTSRANKPATLALNNNSSNRRRRRPQHYSPSKSLLSLLATVVADSSAASAAPAPLPLPFLYPGLDNHQQVHEDEDLLASQSQAKLQRRFQQRRNRFPEKYEQGTDGRWRRVEKYTLYGSTMCTNCGTAGIPPINDVASPPSTSSQPPISTSTTSAVASPTCDSGDTFEDCLPAGWRPLDRRDRTGIILAISLVLAFFICFFIIGCLLWRKSMRKMRDVEQRRQRKRARRAQEEDAEQMLEKQAKSKKKIWARATARWKANAHYTAWKRRGKRRAYNASDISSPTPSQFPVDEDARRTPLASRLSSPAVSRRTSINASRSPSPTSIRRRSATVEPSDRPLTPPPPPSRPPTPPLASPPAYHQRNRSHSELPSVSTSGSSYALASKSVSDNLSTRPTTAQTSQPSFQRSSSPSPPPPDHPDPYSHSVIGGHIATDDKAILQRLTQQASAPTEGTLEDPAHSRASISAPVWEDEDPADFGEENCPGEPSSSARAPEFPHTPSRHPLFPPLPSSVPTSEKGKMAQYYEYEYTFEDEGSGPSAPPSFDYTHGPRPSAPPIAAEVDEDEDALEYVDEPSAPPLPESPYDESHHDGPSAPEDNSRDENDEHSDHRHDSRRDSQLGRLGLDFGSPSSTSLSRDNTLPLYHP